MAESNNSWQSYAQIFGDLLSFDFESELYQRSEQLGAPHPQAQFLANKCTQVMSDTRSKHTTLNQDPENPRRRLYKVFESFKHTSAFLRLSPHGNEHNFPLDPLDSGERSKVRYDGIGVAGKVEANKAARQALADSLTGKQAHFTAGGNQFPSGNTGDGQPKNPKKAKAPKAGYGSQPKCKILSGEFVSGSLLQHLQFTISCRLRPLKNSVKKHGKRIWRSGGLTWKIILFGFESPITTKPEACSPWQQSPDCSASFDHSWHREPRGAYIWRFSLTWKPIQSIYVGKLELSKNLPTHTMQWRG